MERAILKAAAFNILLALSICSVLHAQTGFMSLDCGGEGEYNDARGISWTSDEEYIKTGEKKGILSGELEGEVEQPLKQLRCFPQGKRNCYNLAALWGRKYIIRVSFLYGNYDGLQSQPQFELLVDANPWTTVVINNSREIIHKEIIVMAKGNSINVCVGRSTDDVPFISALELRLLKPSMYDIVGQDLSLLSIQHMDYGRLSKSPLRYPQDEFDRIWVNGGGNDLVYRNTTNSIPTIEKFEIPSAVLETALVTRNRSVGIITWNWNVAELGEYYFTICFAEVEQLGGGIREFNVTVNEYPWHSMTLDHYLKAFCTFGRWEFSDSKQVKFNLIPTNRSTAGAILNAFEVYQYSSPLNNGTYTADVNALNDIARHFNLDKESTGDPCVPQKYRWNWVDCNQDSSPPRIIAVTLPDKRLNGTIPPSFGTLSALVKLDLARNNLSGSIPENLATLSNLNELNLIENDLNGSVPIGLSEKQQRGELALSVYGNDMLCQTGICKDAHKRQTNKSLVVWLIVAGVATLITITAILMFTKLKFGRKIRKGKTETGHLDLVKLDGCRSFSYEEVRVMTGSFQTEIGKGGYGSVYLGSFQGKNVAVKILSDKSHQGALEFSTEVNILSKLHHKNLVKFMGYCTEEQKLVLIYEYMSNGDLRHCLDGQTSSRNILEWERRLEIATDAAQGLEYLHVGCRPGIIHRDIKSSNILLNDHMEAKIADFGLSKLGPLDGDTHVSTLVKGTTGYLDPEYYTAHRLTEKSDVYSFGVVLMEIISGRHPRFEDPSTSTSEQIHITNWVKESIRKGDIENIVDPTLVKNYNTDAMWKVAELAMACTSAYSMNRPSMNEVVLELKEASRFQTHYYQNVEFHEFASPHPLLASRNYGDVDSNMSLYPAAR